MSAKIFKNRIPDSVLSNDFKRDGETRHGGDLNHIVTATKGGINYNAKLIESFLYGDNYKPFYHGDEMDWQTDPRYITWGTVYWVRSALNETSDEFYYVTRMKFNNSKGSWEDMGIIDLSEFVTLPIDNNTIVRNENKEIMVSPNLTIDGGYL